VEGLAVLVVDFGIELSEFETFVDIIVDRGRWATEPLEFMSDRIGMDDVEILVQDSKGARVIDGVHYEFALYEWTVDGVCAIGMVIVLLTVGFDAHGPAKGVVLRIVALVLSARREVWFVIVDVMGVSFMNDDSIIELRVVVSLS